MKQEQLQKSIVGGEMEISLCAEDGVQFDNQLFRPDATKGYFQFSCSYGFPVTTHYGTGLHPAVIAKSYKSFIDQNLNREHQIASYHTDRPDAEDKIIGTVRAVAFPTEPYGGWKIQSDMSKSPCVTGVASVFKQAKAVAKLLGDHLSGRKKYAVSMEVLWPLEEAGFAVALNGKDPIYDFSPKDFLEAGYEYIPWDSAPDALKATWSKKKTRVIAAWKGRKVSVLMGGLSNPVHYAGLGVVQFGAEPPAKIVRLAASDSGKSEKLSALGDRLNTVFAIAAKLKG